MDEKTLEMAKRQAAICRLFASERRILILWTLVEQEKSVSEIATAVDASMQNTSQHLHLMKEKGILQSHRDGQTIYYRIADDENTQLCQLLIEKHKKQLSGQPDRFPLETMLNVTSEKDRSGFQ